MKYYIIAGEASGDLHASNLMKQIRHLDPEARFRCWGGDLMEAEGGELVRHYRDLAFMGFTEVLANLGTILKNIRFCKEDIAQYQPDAVILVDYPGFNLRIAEFAGAAGFKVIYYISPQVWAWKKSRIRKIRRFVNKMLVILPFEEDFYMKHGYRVEFVGHPLLDVIDGEGPVPVEGKPVIALLPGSREQEISKMLPVMLSIRDQFPGYRFIVSAAPGIDESFYRYYDTGHDMELWKDGTRSLLSVARAAVVTSGTATLETALQRVPEVVCYKGGAVSYIIAKNMVNIKYISLVNLIMDKEVVRELIQSDFNHANLVAELEKILDEENRTRMLKDFEELAKKLGGPGASAKAARSVISLIKTGK